MEVISAAILSHKPKDVKSFVVQGFIITPQHVQLLLNQTIECKTFEVSTARTNLTKTANLLKAHKTMSIQDLLLNKEISNLMRALDTNFINLVDSWDKELIS